MAIARRKVALDKSVAEGPPFKDEWLLKKWPNVHEWLTATVYEDASPRTPGKIAFKLQDGSICGTVSDEDAKASCYVQGDSIMTVLSAMDRAVVNPETRWIVWPSERLKKRQK